MAAIWVGGGVMIQFFALRILGSGEPARQVALGGDVEWISNRLIVPASLLAVLAFLLARHGLATRVVEAPARASR
jgi:hypothetical protein